MTDMEQREMEDRSRSWGTRRGLTNERGTHGKRCRTHAGWDVRRCCSRRNAAGPAWCTPAGCPPGAPSWRSADKHTWRCFKERDIATWHRQMQTAAVSQSALEQNQCVLIEKDYRLAKSVLVCIIGHELWLHFQSDSFKYRDKYLSLHHSPLQRTFEVLLFRVLIIITGKDRSHGKLIFTPWERSDCYDCWLEQTFVSNKMYNKSPSRECEVKKASFQKGQILRNTLNWFKMGAG